MTPVICVTVLQMQISTASKALATSKENSETITHQLKTLKEESESNMASMGKKHLLNVRILKDKV